MQSALYIRMIRRAFWRSTGKKGTRTNSQRMLNDVVPWKSCRSCVWMWALLRIRTFNRTRNLSQLWLVDSNSKCNVSTALLIGYSWFAANLCDVIFIKLFTIEALEEQYAFRNIQNSMIYYDMIAFTLLLLLWHWTDTHIRRHSFPVMKTIKLPVRHKKG